MGNFERDRVNSWARLAANVGLLLTDRKLRKALGREARSRFDHATDTISDKYEDAVTRLESAAHALHGGRTWPSRVTALLMGVGIGAGIGIMLAPAAGTQTRRSIRDKTVDLKNRVVESASSAARRVGSPGSDLRATGSEG